MLKIIFVRRNLISDFVINDIKGRYLGSFLGFWGSVINPLLLLLIYCFVFSGILKIKFGLSDRTGNFAIYLFCGLVPWMSFSEAVQRSSTVLLDKGPLIKRVLFPKEILPFYLTVASFINQVIALSVFLVILLVVQFEFGKYIILLFFVFPLELLFTFGCCLLVSSLYVFFRDIGIFLGTLLQIWFFCTPIFYPVSIIPPGFIPFMEINPMFHLVCIYREIVLHNSMPPLKNIGCFALASIIAFFVGSFVFVRIKDKIVDYL